LFVERLADLFGPIMTWGLSGQWMTVCAQRFKDASESTTQHLLIVDVDLD
jgi:hypothetical protein